MKVKLMLKVFQDVRELLEIEDCGEESRKWREELVKRYYRNVMSLKVS